MTDLKTDLELALDGVDRYIDALKTVHKDDIYDTTNSRGELLLVPVLLIKFEILKALTELDNTVNCKNELPYDPKKFLINTDSILRQNRHDTKPPHNWMGPAPEPNKYGATCICMGCQTLVRLKELE